MTGLRARIGALATAALLAASLTACSGGGHDSSAAAGSSAPATTANRTVGAAHLDAGYILAGHGKTVVDVYFDPMCPICGAFEQANGKQLAGLVNDGTITLRLHTMTFLNPASQGTDYSTRAAAALTCVAATDPKHTLDYLAALYAQQPAENSAGLPDSKLVALAGEVGASNISSCVTAGTYKQWVQAVNDRALAGPIPDADIPSVKGTPTVLINGRNYAGPVTDPQALAEAIKAG